MCTFVLSNPIVTFIKDRHNLTFPAYINGKSLLNFWAHINVLDLSMRTYGLIATSFSSNTSPITLVKRINRFTHAPGSEMVVRLVKAGYDRGPAAIVSCKVPGSCIVCVKPGTSLTFWKISFIQDCEGFNEKVQTGFLSQFGPPSTAPSKLWTQNFISEASIANQKTTSKVTALIELMRIYRHGRPKSFSADSKVRRGSMKALLNPHNITISKECVTWLIISVLVERINPTLKSLFKQLQNNKPKDSNAVLFSRAIFLFSKFSGSRIPSSFTLARGYSPAFPRVPRSLIYYKIINAF